MPKSYTSEIQTWEGANAYLGSKDARPLPHSKNLWIARERAENLRIDGKSLDPQGIGFSVITVRLHGFIIVLFRGKHFAAEFPYRGHFENSPTTKRHRSAFGGPWRV